MAKREGLPSERELVLCTVERITPYAAWCKLDEYDGEGMIHISEVAGKWIHDIREFVKVGKQYVAKVVRVDQQKKLVNLSLKRVSRYDEKDKMNESRKEQRGEKLLEQAAKEMNKALKDAYEEVGFLLQGKFGDLFTAFEEIRKSKNELQKMGISKSWIEALYNVAERSFKEKKVILRVELELKSYAEDGADRIKKILSGLDMGGVEIRYISAPRYRLELKTTDPKIAEKNLREKLDAMVKDSKTADVESSYRFVR